MYLRRARRGAALTLCLALLAGLSAGCSAVANPVHSSAVADGPSSPAASQTARTTPSVVMFLGDSYTVGESGVAPEETYASATARLLGWQVIIGGRGGTGFVKTTNGSDDFLGMFELQLGWRPAPDLLIVSGGHNDRRLPGPQVAAAARTLLERVAQRWPGTHVVLMGPLWGNGTPTPQVLGVRDSLQQLAGRLGVPFVDPIAEKWVTGGAMGGGNAARYIKNDGTHPTPEGHRYLATRLVADIERLGLAQPVRDAP
ncbi:SGNH/GDSL hydrolase family protein [Actinomadura sp. CNU-125]|uniref:SGNH/GDSL hydrolase family protein n=1 Tax=Actinomadura sp. CNU-125 TaxID=1904961 RepID=UPI000AC7522B|nr:SGNH/GDSL hydrolase family protein [Actinomadura sp. CNU-125]